MDQKMKLYDADGNEVTGRPEEGVTYYDADGNELKAPEAGHGGPGGHGGPRGERPKMYDADGNELKGPGAENQ